MARYRRLLPALGVILLLVAAVVVLAVRSGRPAALEPRPPQSPPAARSWPVGTWELTHRIDLPNGWTANRREVWAERSRTEVGGRLAALLPASTDDFANCLVTVLRPGQRMRRPASAERVSVGDVPAEYTGRRGGGKPDGLFWRGPSGGWANVRCFADGERDERAETLALAERVRFTPSPVTVPVRLASLPRGYHPDHLEYREAEAGMLILRADADGAELAYLAAWHVRSLTAPDNAEEGMLNGRPVIMKALDRLLCYTLEPVACVGEWSTDPMGNSDRWPLGIRQLLADTAAELVFPANIADRGTWFAGREAFPG